MNDDEKVTFITILPNMRVKNMRFRNYFLTVDKKTAEELKESEGYRLHYWVDEELEDALISGDDSRFPEKAAKELRKYFLARRKAEAKKHKKEEKEKEKEKSHKAKI